MPQVSKVKIVAKAVFYTDPTGIVYHNANLSLDANIVMLSGPRYGHIADGILINTSTTYEDSEYDISLEVFTDTGKGLFRREFWWVGFR